MFFDKVAEIWDGSAEARVPDDESTFDCSVWEEVGGSETGRGERYDARGEVEAAAAPYLIRQANRRLKVNGISYSVVGAVHHDYLEHVEVLLAELRPAG